MSARARLVGAALAALVLVVGCGGASPDQTPEGAVAALASALRRGDSASAYRLMSRSYRQHVSYDEFVAMLERDRDEVAQSAELLARAAGPAEQTASIELGEHERVDMVREGGSWRVSTDVVDFYGQSTPRDALRSFVRAVEHRRYDVVLRLVPAADRTEMTAESLRASWEGEGREEIQRIVASLRAALEHPIEIVGDRATMTYGDHQRVQFVREDGVWRVEDPE